MHPESSTVERSDFLVTQNKKEEKLQDKSEEKNTNILFAFLIVITMIGSFTMTSVISEFRQELMEANPEYNFPKMSDFLMALKICPLIAVSLS
jgi:hypothetical protein